MLYSLHMLYDVAGKRVIMYEIFLVNFWVIICVGLSAIAELLVLEAMQENTHTGLSFSRNAVCMLHNMCLVCVTVSLK